MVTPIDRVRARGFKSGWVAAPFALALTLAGLTGCGSGPALATSEGPRYEATATILEGGGHGPQLCFAILQARPPQCGGPDVIGLRWEDLPNRQRVDGSLGSTEPITWADRVRVVGTWRDGALTLTEPAREVALASANGPDEERRRLLDRMRTPCAPPAGGWIPVDSARTTRKALRQAQAAAGRRRDHAGTWLDPSIHPASPRPVIFNNYPRWTILNVRVTGDVADARRDLRRVWGGSLCVTKAPRTRARLFAVQRALAEEWRTIGMLSSAIEVEQNTVTLDVVFDDGTLQRRLDRKYGRGTVRVNSAVRRVG